jgi:hypothetical protein
MRIATWFASAGNMNGEEQAPGSLAIADQLTSSVGGRMAPGGGDSMFSTSKRDQSKTSLMIGMRRLRYKTWPFQFLEARVTNSEVTSEVSAIWLSLYCLDRLLPHDICFMTPKFLNNHRTSANGTVVASVVAIDWPPVRFRVGAPATPFRSFFELDLITFGPYHDT